MNLRLKKCHVLEAMMKKCARTYISEGNLRYAYAVQFHTSAKFVGQLS